MVYFDMASRVERKKRLPTKCKNLMVYSILISTSSYAPKKRLPTKLKSCVVLTSCRPRTPKSVCRQNAFRWRFVLILRPELEHRKASTDKMLNKVPRFVMVYASTAVMELRYTAHIWGLISSYVFINPIISKLTIFVEYGRIYNYYIIIIFVPVELVTFSKSYEATSFILASFEGVQSKVQSSTRRKHVKTKSFQTPYKHASRMTFFLQTQKLFI